MKSTDLGCSSKQTKQLRAGPNAMPRAQVNWVRMMKNCRTSRDTICEEPYHVAIVTPANMLYEVTAPDSANSADINMKLKSSQVYVAILWEGTRG